MNESQATKTPVKTGFTIGLNLGMFFLAIMTLAHMLIAAGHSSTREFFTSYYSIEGAILIFYSLIVIPLAVGWLVGHIQSHVQEIGLNEYKDISRWAKRHPQLKALISNPEKINVSSLKKIKKAKEGIELEIEMKNDIINKLEGHITDNRALQEMSLEELLDIEDKFDVETQNIQSAKDAEELSQIKEALH